MVRGRCGLVTVWRGVGDLTLMLYPLASASKRAAWWAGAAEAESGQESAFFFLTHSGALFVEVYVRRVKWRLRAKTGARSAARQR